MAEVLPVEVRQDCGKRRMRRMRAGGRIPAVLYGHGQEVVNLSVPTDALDAVLRHGSRVVTLKGGANEQALIRELQWDTWGMHVLHADFTRISADETVDVAIPLELRGEAPGVKEGGIVEQVMHEIGISCRATNIPEKLEININHLQLGDSITVADLEIPEGGKCLADPEETVVHCIEPIVAPEEVEEAGEAEPEVIGERKEDESASED